MRQKLLPLALADGTLDEGRQQIRIGMAAMNCGRRRPCQAVTYEFGKL